MCEALKDVPADEWDTLKADVKSLKENQQTMLEERAGLKGWLRGWLVGVGGVFVVVQLVGGYFINRALELPEKNAVAINELREIVKENIVKDTAHHGNAELHVDPKEMRMDFIPRPELNLTLASMEQRNAQTRSEIDRQFMDVKERIITMEATAASRGEKIEEKLDKLFDKLKDAGR